MEKLREINRFNPGFMRCVINIAANYAVGSTSQQGDIEERAMNYVIAKRKQAHHKFNNIGHGQDFERERP